MIAVPRPCPCEPVWILRRGAKRATADAAAALRARLDTGTVAMNRTAVEAGLKPLEAGGACADGVIACEGRWLGGETFVSFDRRAVALLAQHGAATRRLS